MTATAGAGFARDPGTDAAQRAGAAPTRSALWRRLLPFVVLSLVLGAGSGLVAHSSYLDLAEARLSSKASALAASVDRRLIAMMTALRGIATSQALEDAGASGAGWAETARAVTDRFGGWVALATVQDGLRTRIDGTVGVGETEDRGHLTVGHPALFEAARQAVWTGRIDLVSLPEPRSASHVDAAIVLPLAAPREDQVLVYGFDPSYLLPAVGDWQDDAGIGALVADGGLRIVARSHGGGLTDAELTRMLERAPTGVRSGPLEGATAGGGPAPGWFTRIERFPEWTAAVSQHDADGTANSFGFLWGPFVAIIFAVGATLAVLYQDRATYARRREAFDAGRRTIARLHEELPLVLFAVRLGADDKLDVRYVGGNIERVTGWPAERLATPADWRHLCSDDTPDLATLIRQLRRRDSVSAEWRMRGPDGSWAFMRTDASVGARDGDAVSAVGYVTNVSDRHAALERAQAAGRLASIGEMASGIAHELKQPLTTIGLAVGNARAAIRARDAEATVPRLRTAVAQAKRAARTIDHLCQFGEHGTIDEGALTMVSVREAVEGALSLVGAGLFEMGIMVEVEIGEPEPFVRAQRLPVEQVLINLLINAKDAICARPSGDHAVAIRAGVVGDTVEVTVCDTGGGIPDRIMADLFQPFVTTKAADLGTGLGLSVSAGIVKAFGGTITACNTERGALITIDLPAAAPA